ncbi:egl-5 [Pristionchus pacificus]|nr:egl-5 [Pristionchus pacificus]
MNVVSTDAASTSSASTTSTTTPFDVTNGGRIKGEGGEDHLARLANLAQGVGKEDSDSTATSTPTAADAPLYPGYMPGYTGWPQYYQQFAAQPGITPAAFSAWPAQWNGAAAMSGWPAYAQSKKGRQTYQRYQTSVLEQKFLQSSYVSKKQREELRMQTNLTDRQIKIWFQNRRMKAKKEKHRLEEGGEHSTLLPPTKGSIPLPHGSLPALPVGLQQLQHMQQQQPQPDGSCSVGSSIEDKDKQHGWAHMAPNPLLTHQFWPTSQTHPYAIPQYQLCPPNI